MRSLRAAVPLALAVGLVAAAPARQPTRRRRRRRRPPAATPSSSSTRRSSGPASAAPSVRSSARREKIENGKLDKAADDAEGRAPPAGRRLARRQVRDPDGAAAAARGGRCAGARPQGRRRPGRADLRHAARDGGPGADPACTTWRPASSALIDGSHGTGLDALSTTLNMVERPARPGAAVHPQRGAAGAAGGRRRAPRARSREPGRGRGADVRRP